MNRLEWILGILLVVLLLVVAGLSLKFWLQSSDSNTLSETDLVLDPLQAAPTAVFQGQTAKIAYASARQAAVSWQSDAALLNLSGDWPHGVSLASLQNGTTTWTFTFYSPATNKTAAFSVIEGETALIYEGQHQLQSPLVNIGSWQIDSHEAIDIFLQQGGEAFIREQGVTTVTVVMTNDQEQITWNVTSLSPKAGRAFSVQINAGNGDVLAVNPAS